MNDAPAPVPRPGYSTLVPVLVGAALFSSLLGIASDLAPGWDEKVMHSTLRVGGAILMAADGCSPEDKTSGGFKLALNVPTEAEAKRAFAALADGGSVEMPLTKTFWSPQFGMLTDRFGIAWMISVPPAQ